MLLLWCGVLVLVASLLLLAFSSNKTPPAILKGDVLLVIAHPDDEAMFFAPTLVHLKKNFIKVHILCLSTGNFNSLGKVREKELQRSGTFFGASSVYVMDHPQLQDGMGQSWSGQLISELLARHINFLAMPNHSTSCSVTIRTILTFDVHGVSQHPNHVDVHRGVVQWSNSYSAKLNKRDDDAHPVVKVLQLKTVWIGHKYCGMLSILVSMLRSATTKIKEDRRGEMPFTIVTRSVMASFYAMRIHKSQMVWFRYLFVCCSSYSFVNHWSYVEIMRRKKNLSQ